MHTQFFWPAVVSVICIAFGSACSTDHVTLRGRTSDAGVFGISDSTVGTAGAPSFEPRGSGAPCMAKSPACNDGEYCRFTLTEHCGQHDQLGTCETMPKQCADTGRTVCGCDGLDYPDECAAARSGISIAQASSCVLSPDGPVTAPDEVDGGTLATCGGPADGSCPADEYCSYGFANECATKGATGICTKRPKTCPSEYEPVCGCDGNTYPGDCSAAMSGVSIVTRVACPAADGGVVGVCGGGPAATCAQDLYCKYAADSACGRTGMTGMCSAVPRACIATHDPVCGCDGRTYDSECVAASAGVAVDSRGACATTK